MRDEFEGQDKVEHRDAWKRVPQIEMDLSAGSEVVHLALQKRFQNAKALHWEREADGATGYAWDGPRAIAFLVHRAT